MNTCYMLGIPPHGVEVDRKIERLPFSWKAYSGQISLSLGHLQCGIRILLPATFGELQGGLI